MPDDQTPAPADTEGFRVTAGQGQYHHQSLTNRKGEPNDHPDAGKPYPTASYEDLRELMADPATCAKADAYWMLASAYNAPDARTFKVQEERGAFCYLLVDIDEGNKPLSGIEAAMAAVVPGARALINSSASATADNRKWHITIPLDVQIPYEAFKAYQTALYYWLTFNGFKCDWSLARSAQLFYLPSRADPDGYYECAEIPGEPLNAGDQSTWLYQEAARRYQADCIARARAEAATRRDGGSANSIINWVNLHYNTEDLLEGYGYSCDGREYSSPYQQSGSGGHSTMVRPDGSWFSLSDSDDSAGVGRQTAGGRHGDAFDLIKHYAYQNDEQRALDWARSQRRQVEAADPVSQSVQAFVDNLTAEAQQ